MTFSIKTASKEANDGRPRESIPTVYSLVLKPLVLFLILHWGFLRSLTERWFLAALAATIFVLSFWTLKQGLHDAADFGVLAKHDLWKKYKRFTTMKGSVHGPLYNSPSCWTDVFLGRITDRVKDALQTWFPRLDRVLTTTPLAAHSSSLGRL
ncbi:hypothetical protein QBC46DRAFT_337953 [Diplogelasinospora grovesii]|uniref:Uncharacterized protein n=1 Tax=Diplogelasinospora grovesii TaxID=303347 RepID=A0AAN6NDR1_9PEZI|nr:hypothetical protein QBC46DRAFT_337953 [Diplogelasinospora grovesii]